MIRSEPGTIVLVKFPFTDFSSTKKRPAVVISPVLYGSRYGDTVVVPLTSVDQKDESLKLLHWKESGLIKSTWAKPLLATVATSLIERELGQLSEEDEACIRAALRQMLSSFIYIA